VLTTLIATAEPSKVPFYIAGGLLAVWAVVLSSFGLTRPAFPFGVTGQRAVMAISLVLAAFAVGTAIAVK
jgi:type IV secretory pathway VirB3-like protein